MFLRDTRELLRKQFFLATNHQVMLRRCPEGSPPDHSLHTLFRYDFHKSVRNDVQKSANLNTFCNDCIDEKYASFVGMVQVYIYKTVTPLKVNSVVVYPGHVVLLDFRKEFCWFLIDRGYTFAGLQSVCTANNEQDEHEEIIEIQFEIEPSVVPLCDTMSFSMEKGASNMKLQVLHDAMQTFLHRFSDCVRTGCSVNMREGTYRCHPTLILYYCDILERKCMFEAKHGGTAYP